MNHIQLNDLITMNTQSKINNINRQTGRMYQKAKSTLNLKQQTQKALKTINQYQRTRQISLMAYTQKHFVTQTSFNIGHSKELGFNNVNSINIKIFQPKQKLRLQLLPNTSVYYQIQINAEIESKIIIRNVRGGVSQIYIFYDKLSKQLRKANHHFVIRSQIILKLSKKLFQASKCIYLVFQSNEELSMLTFRMDYIRKKKKVNELKNDKSIQSIDLEELNHGQQKLARSKSTRLKNKTKQITMFKPEQKLKKIAQLKSLELQKKQASKKRIQNIEIYKQKSAQAMKIVAVCKKMFNTYQQLVQNQQKKKAQTIFQNCHVIYAMKYCLLSSMFFNERQKNNRRIFMIKNYQRKFIKKIRRYYRQTKAIQPSQKLRQVQVFSKCTSFIGNSLFKVDLNKAVSAIFETFSICQPRFLINLSMNQASKYRRVVRGVQKRWKSIYQNRMYFLINYVDQQLNSIIAAFPQLQVVQQQFRKSTKAHQICIQYQKQTAGKMKHQIASYKHKLQQREQYIRINKNIQQSNRTALRKNQRQLLQVPPKPSFPQFRFYRDALFLKSMVRGQLEVLYRKYRKRNPELIIEKTEEKSPRKNKKGK